MSGGGRGARLAREGSAAWMAAIKRTGTYLQRLPARAT
jgi:hypothetical protein